MLASRYQRPPSASARKHIRRGTTTAEYRMHSMMTTSHCCLFGPDGEMMRGGHASRFLEERARSERGASSSGAYAAAPSAEEDDVGRASIVTFQAVHRSLARSQRNKNRGRGVSFLATLCVCASAFF